MITFTTMLASATFKTITTAAATAAVATGIILKVDNKKLVQHLAKAMDKAQAKVKAKATKTK